MNKYHLVNKKENMAKTIEFPPWWKNHAEQFIRIGEEHSPCYLYNKQRVTERISSLRTNLASIDSFFYAMKANNNKELLKVVIDNNFGIETVSINELDYIFNTFPTLSPSRVLFTPNFAGREEYHKALDYGVNVTIDNIYILEHWKSTFQGKKIILRIDPDITEGHHRHVCTAGQNAKFGIPWQEVDNAVELASQAQIKIFGIHAHGGSGITRIKYWQLLGEFLRKTAHKIPSLEILNLGGGLGIPYKPTDKELNLMLLEKKFSKLKNQMTGLSLWLEPGRFIVADSGVILTKVNQIKHKGDICYIGVNTGMNSLIRPVLYGAYHQIVNLSRLGEPNHINANIVGSICESGDFLGTNRPMPETSEGDIMLIDTAGAYGYVMSSTYNMRPPAKEIVLP